MPAKRKRKKMDKRDKAQAKARRERRKTALERSRILVDHCLKMERWGPNPGVSKLRLESRLYDPQVRQYHKVPGKSINIMIDSFEGLEEIWAVIEAGLQAYSKGRFVSGALQCSCGRLL